MAVLQLLCVPPSCVLGALGAAPCALCTRRPVCSAHAEQRSTHSVHHTSRASQNVVPVIVSSLEGDVPRVRAAIWIGCAAPSPVQPSLAHCVVALTTAERACRLSIPLLMFVGWEGAMIGSLPSGARRQRRRLVHAPQGGHGVRKSLLRLSDRMRTWIVSIPRRDVQVLSRI